LFGTTSFILLVLTLFASIASAINMSYDDQNHSGMSSVDTAHQDDAGEERESSSGERSSQETPGASPEAQPPSSLSMNDILLQRLVESITVIASANQRAAIQERPPFDTKELSFNGDNVTEFLEAIEERGAFYGWTVGQKLERVLAFSDRDHRMIIDSSIPGFSEAKASLDWDKAKTALRRRFRDQDSIQMEETEDALRTWLSQCASIDDLSLQSYLDLFGTRFSRCEKAGTVSPAQKGWYLVRGLNSARLRKVLSKFNLELSQEQDFNYVEIQRFLAQIAQRDADIERFNPALVRSVRAPTKAASKAASGSVPVPASFRNPTLHLPAVMPPLPASVTTARRPQGAPGVSQPPGSIGTQNEIDSLVNRFNDMKLNNITVQLWSTRESELLAQPDIYQEIVQRTASTGPAPYVTPAGLSNNSYGPAQHHQVNTLRPTNSEPNLQRPSGCNGCGSIDHLVRNCPERNALIKNGWFYYNF
jgi:hypothetical protein